MEEVMATRKTASKTPAAKATKTAAKAESKPAAAPAKRAAPAAPKRPPAAATSRPAAAAPAPRETPRPQARPVEAPTGEARYRWIAHAAYLRAEKRGFAPGQEIDDWLAAEAEFLATHGAR
jgi:hypothetical protein